MKLILMLSLTLAAASAHAFPNSEVYSCNGGALKVFFEGGEYGSSDAKIVITDQGVARYVMDGQFAIGRCQGQERRSPGNRICRNAQGAIEIGTSGGDHRRRFTWTKSHEHKEIQSGRPAQLVAWRDLQAAPNGSGVRFQLMSDMEQYTIDCGPTGEGPCREGYRSARKITYRDWFFNDCKAAR
jgi:hypothetical protein